MQGASAKNINNLFNQYQRYSNAPKTSSDQRRTNNVRPAIVSYQSEEPALVGPKYGNKASIGLPSLHKSMQEINI